MVTQNAKASEPTHLGESQLDICKADVNVTEQEVQRCRRLLAKWEADLVNAEDAHERALAAYQVALENEQSQYEAIRGSHRRQDPEEVEASEPKPSPLVHEDKPVEANSTTISPMANAEEEEVQKTSFLEGAQATWSSCKAGWRKLADWFNNHAAK